jgi:class 3 adenylate cyclase
MNVLVNLIVGWVEGVLDRVMGVILTVARQVNVASRMESTGVAGEIQVSSDYMVQVGEWFEMEERGAVNVKGKGEMRPWLLKVRHLRKAS